MTIATPPATLQPAYANAYPVAGQPATGLRRILMTVDAVGGVWRYAMELAAALRSCGVNTVFAGFGPRPSRAQESEAMRFGELVWTSQPLDWMVDDERKLDGIPQALEELVDALDIDLLHLNLPSQACGLDVGKPVVVVSHSCVVTWWATMRGSALPDHWAWQRRRNAEGFARADAVIAPSGSHAEQLHRCYGWLPKLTVVHNSISAFLHGGDKEPFVFAAGRWWDEGKNAAVLDAAAAHVHWPVKLAGAVASPDGSPIALQTADALGELSHRDVLAHIRRAGIVVSPSLYEPFGLAALEGARAGAALVLSNIPTYRELWSGAAIFFEPRDSDSLAAAIGKLSQDSTLREEMGARALARSRQYMPHLQARTVADLYEKLLELPAIPIAREVATPET